MPLHICFVDYHSEMKFEQLLKIICKRYFLLFFFYIIPLLHPPVLLFVGGVGSGGRGHNVNRHTELLWCWLCFQNIFWGLIPIAGSWVFIPFFVSILYCCFWNIYDGIWGTVKGGLLLDLSFSRKKICHVRCRQHSLTLAVKRLPCSQVGILLYE